jgi:glycine dehydrogenase
VRGSVHEYQYQYQEKFQARHIAPNETDTAKMLKTVKADSLDQLIEQTVPAKIRLKLRLTCRQQKASLII